MPTRILRDGILESIAVNSLSDSGELFFRRLMSLVDDYGRCEFTINTLRARLFGQILDRWPNERVEASLLECSEAIRTDGQCLISIYSVEGSTAKYLQINDFEQRIRVDRKGNKAQSRCPPPHVAAKRGDTPPETKAKPSALREKTTNTETILVLEKPRIEDLKVSRPPREKTALAETPPLPVVSPPPAKLHFKPPEPERETQFHAFWERYRKLRDAGRQDQACRAWISYECERHADEVFACLENYERSRDVAQGAVQNADKWLQAVFESKFLARWNSAERKRPHMQSTYELLKAQGLVQ